MFYDDFFFKLDQNRTILHYILPTFLLERTPDPLHLSKSHKPFNFDFQSRISTTKIQ